MEVWITRQEENIEDTCRYPAGKYPDFSGKWRWYLCAFAYPDSVCEWDSFLVSVTVTALLCAVLFRLREHLVAAVSR